MLINVSILFVIYTQPVPNNRMTSCISCGALITSNKVCDFLSRANIKIFKGSRDHSKDSNSYQHPVSQGSFIDNTHLIWISNVTINRLTVFVMPSLAINPLKRHCCFFVFINSSITLFLCIYVAFQTLKIFVLSLKITQIIVFLEGYLPLVLFLQK